MDYEKILFDRATSTLKVHGILSIIFGCIGILAASLFTLLLMLAGASSIPIDEELGISIAASFLALLIFVFWTIPHAYLIVSGSYLIRKSPPKLVKTLVIINLVIGLFWNVAFLILSIINLTELDGYERGYHAHRKHAHKS